MVLLYRCCEKRACHLSLRRLGSTGRGVLRRPEEPLTLANMDETRRNGDVRGFKRHLILG